MRACWLALHASLTQSLNTSKSKKEFNEMKAGRDELAGYENAHELVAYLRDGKMEAASRNAPLRGLVAAAQSTDPWAGLARSLLLLSMMAALEATAGRKRGRMCAEEVMAEVVAEFYERIRRLDLDKDPKVAATLVKNTERGVGERGSKARRAQAAEVHVDAETIVDERTEEPKEPAILGVRRANGEADAAMALHEWMTPVVGEKDADLVLGAVVAEQSQRELADELGVTHAAARKRLGRALDKLHDHLSDREPEQP
jgi:DNA-directed RNA polymerase specialized sigma24 family protein